MDLPWYTTLMLAMESNQVIGLRMMMLAGGGRGAQDEAERMISEKMEACLEAGATLLTGGSLSLVVDRYREHVAANLGRLTTLGADEVLPQAC